MRAFIENVLNQIREFFGRMSRNDKIRLAILAGVVVILAVVLITFLNRTTYVTLHTAQNMSEAGTITEALREMGEDYQVEGTRILVPEGRASDLRATLAAQGVIDHGAIDYTMLESAAGFNITESQAKEYYARQTAGEIRTQILMADNIQNAVVTIKPGESSPFLFAQGVKEATASVMLVIRGGATLTASEAQQIADLVKNSVPGITYENITITDNQWNRYQIGDGTTDLSTEMQRRIQMQNLLQQQMQLQAEQAIVPIYGMHNLRITANVSLNFDREFTEQIEFFPPIPGEMDGIVRSAYELYENQRNAGAAVGVPGTDPNGMGTVEYPYATLEDGDEYRRVQLETNYEINQTIRTIEHEQGKVERASIAITINDNAVVDDNTTQVRNLVSKALGIHPDNIAVEQIAFLYPGISYEEIERQYQEELAIRRRRENMETIFRYAVILVLIAAAFLLARMIIRILSPQPEPVPALVDGEGAEGFDYLIDDGDGAYEDEVELRQKSSALEQIERFIDKDPASVAQLLRNWLTDD